MGIMDQWATILSILNAVHPREKSPITKIGDDNIFEGFAYQF